MTTGPVEREAVIDTTTRSVVAECSAVSRTFGSGAAAVHAVREVSCQIPSRARIALTGPSGSGKSTLLHLLAGIDVPSTGEVRWPALGHDRHRRRRAIGVVFQGPSLLPSLDVTENVALPLLFGGQADDTATRRARAALDLVGIGDLAAKLPDELSEGQLQRVVIARVLATRPALILADEPTGRLDHNNAERVVAVLLDTASAIGGAVIIATHDASVAARFPDRWVMRDGQLFTNPDADRDVT
jgi:putative ABC transport system ATP-binding protein